MKTIQQIADFLHAEFTGDATQAITGVGSLEHATPGQIIFALDNIKFKKALQTGASAIIVPLPFKETSTGRNLIFHPNPRFAFAQLIHLLHPATKITPGIDPTARVSESAQIGKEVTLMAGVVIGEKVQIGDQTVVYPNVVIGNGVKIGNNCTIRANVTLYDQIEIGNRVIIHSGTVVGSDGFGYVMDENTGRYYKIPQIGTVIIEDDVEIGANTAIDRGAIGETRIKQGTKIDNLVQIGHNDVIGEHTTISGQAGISGSVTLGKYCVVAGQVGIADHVTIGDQVILAAQAGVSKSLPKKGIYWGTPVQELSQEKRSWIAYRHLPELSATIKNLQREIAELKAKLNSNESNE